MTASRATVDVVVLALSFVLALPAPASAGEPPIVGYYTDDGVEVASAGGTVLTTYGALDFFSLDGDVLVASRVGTGRESVVAFDATIGERLYRIPNALAPIALDGGTRVGFMPDRFARRDPWFASVWIRNAAGRVRPVVRFYGPNATVDPQGFRGEGIPLDQAWDAAGRTLAVTLGNDVDLFIYDVWVVDVRTGEATRVTRGKESRFPSLSPSGDRLALVREVDHCGGEGPGYRASDLVVMDADGTDRSTLLPGDCNTYFTDPRWISETGLVAARLTRIGDGTYAVDIVRVDAGTGATTDLVTTGDVNFFSVSAGPQLVAYARSSAIQGFFVLDLGTGTTTAFPIGYIPHLSGAHRLI